MSVRGSHAVPRRARALCGAGTAVLLVLLPAAAGTAGAAEPEAAEGEDCPIAAMAQGVQVTVSASNDTLLSAPAGVGVPVAKSCVNYAVGESSGWASSPYPGETVISAPALIGGQTGQKFPDYPLYAASKYPSEDSAKAGRAPHTMRAHSTKTSTDAVAGTVLGKDATGASTRTAAHSSVEPDSLTGKAEASADTRPWSVNGVLDIGRIRSSASAGVDRSGKVARDSELIIGRTEIAGQGVEITPDGLKVAGKSLKLPGGGGADPAEALTQALATAGVKIRYLDEKRTEHGIVSAGLEVRARQQDTRSGSVYTVTYVFGRASADAGRVEAPPGSGDMPPAPAPRAPSGTGGDDGAGAPAPGGGGGADTPKTPSDGGGTPSGPKDTRTVRLATNPTDMGVTGLYIVLAFGAVATFAAGTLLRLLGVKTRWTS